MSKLPPSTTLPDAEMVQCQSMRATMTSTACVRMFNSAQRDRPNPWEGRHHCLTCEFGAMNAGKDPVSVAVPPWSNVCTRCLRRAPRIINGRFCVSCFNRHAEALRGRNAKGGRPRLADRLHTEHLTVSGQMQEQRVAVPQVIGMEEVMVSLARRATAPMLFGRQGHV